MYVPNYVPEPETLPGNITKETNKQRLVFIRNTIGRFCMCSGLVAILSHFAPVSQGVFYTKVLFVVLIFATLSRTILRGKKSEALVATLWLLPIMVSLALAAKEAVLWHIPVWSILFGVCALGMYTAVCGRDFSFVGGYSLSLIFSNVGIATIMVLEGMTPLQSAMALTWNTFGLFYIVYDLASLMSRRRKREEWAAVTDLYRDVFNLVGFIPRVVHHWYRHRILNDLSFDLPFKN